MYIVGLDIGYSNVKVVMGDARIGRANSSIVIPSGAGPLAHMPQPLGNEEDQSDVIRVKVNGENWAAGVEPGRLQSVDRELHKDYSKTNAYLALFHAALLQTQRHVIDHIVTGLPVYQHQDKQYRDRLLKTLSGTHNPVDDKMVKVMNVSVLPQPTGAYLDLVGTFGDVEILEEGRVLIVDPGFFSVDWVALEGGEIRNSSSGSSLKAMSVLLERVNQLIGQDHQGHVGVDRLEKAMRHGESKVLLFGQRIDLQPYLAKAIEQVAPEALTSLRQAIRIDDRNVDVVMIAGGGAEAYREAVADIFPRSQVVVPAEPALSNARGFWSYGT